MVYRTVWAEQALTDLREISEFISQHDPRAAIRLGEAIFARVEKLSEFPFMGRMVPELGRNNLREIIYGSYRIFYRVIERAGCDRDIARLACRPWRAGYCNLAAMDVAG